MTVGQFKRPQDGERRSHRREGGILIEFCVSVMALWLIMAATVDLGRAFSAAHLLQSAARTAARELALGGNSWNAPFQDALLNIFRPDYLVVDLSCLEERAQGQDLTPDGFLMQDLRDQGLVLNLALRPLMIFEDVTVGGQRRRLLRYPGALLLSGQSDNPNSCAREDFAIGIPEINDAASEIRIQPVVEELVSEAYGLDYRSDGPVPPGTASLELRYPFQAVTLSGWRLVDGINRPVLASEADGYATQLDESLGSGTSLIEELDSRDGAGTLQAYAQNGAGQTIPVYGGRLGLGFHGVLNKEVRPYRRVIKAQALAPREVISGGSGSL